MLERCFAADIAHAITLVAIGRRASRRVSNVGVPEALSTKEWVEAIGEAADWEGEVVVIPDEVQPDGQQNNLNFKQDLVVDTSRIRNELGYADLSPRVETLRRTVAWERTDPPEMIESNVFDCNAEDAALEAWR